MRWRLGTRTVGVAYLVVGAAAGGGAVAGGGTVAVTWAAVSGAMGVAWLARTDAEVRPDRIRLPRRGFRHRDVALADVTGVEAPHPWALDPVGRVLLDGGRTARLPGLSRDDLTALAATAGVPLTTGPAPRPPGT